MGLLDFMLSIKRRKINSYLEQGALLLDVRNPDELKNGEIQDAINIPLSALSDQFDAIKLYNRPVIAYCESGIRSAKAVKILKLKNIKAINGGSWKYISKLISAQ